VPHTLARVLRGLFAAAAAAMLGAAWAGPGAAAGASTEVVVTLDAPSAALAVRSSHALTHAARGERPDLRSPHVKGHLRALGALQDAVERRIERTVRGAVVRWRYGVVLNALAVVVPRHRAAEIARVPGVARVWPNTRFRMRLTRTPRAIGATELWGADLSTAGNGLKIGIIDDGVDQSHPFFAPRGFTMPAGFPKGQTAYTTPKVIAARAFPPPGATWRHSAKPFDPEHSAHATHVAGIAAGNAGVSVLGRPISGVAPRAYIGNYKVLTVPTPEVGLDGNAPEIAAGIEAAVRDGMDVVNLSLGEPEIEPARDIVTAAVEGAVRAGVVVTTAAGNDFDEFGRGTVGSPASARSAITVAAATDEGQMAPFSAAGPTPLSLRLKPEVTAPGVAVVSSVPESEGGWAEYSGTSMAAPHVAGAAALLLQRHPTWTPAQVKSAIVGGAVAVPPVSRQPVPVWRQGAGMLNVPRADRAPLFAEPPAVSFGLLRAGATVTRRIRVTDAGAGAGTWAVSEIGAAAGRPVPTLPATVTVPGELTATLRGAGRGDAGGWIVLRRGEEVRRIPYWARVEATALPRPARRLARAGVYRASTAGRPARVDVYRYPEVPAGARVTAKLDGPEIVFRIVLRRPAANFGVAVLSRARGVRVEPRVVYAGSEDRLVGYTGLPIHLNPYLPEFLEPRLVAGAIRPRAGAYDIVFDSRTRAGAGRFAFRFWVSDVKRPTASLASRVVGAGRPLVLRLSDAGAGVDPASVQLSVDGAARPWRLRGGRATIDLGGLARGRHRVTGRVSDYQETRNMENEPRILPNTRQFSFAFEIR
jgi:subtilisin family serine protease